ncbi:MAG: FAD binding domain-containing protein [Spirochaetia bacterium]
MAKTTSIKRDFLCPRNLAALTKIMNTTPHVTIIGSGYSLLIEKQCLDHKTIVSTSKVSELKKFFHGDHYLEIGAAVNIGELLSSTKRELPEIVRKALLETGTETIRNSATIGGALCLKNWRSNCFIPLCILGTEVEIRSFTPEVKKKSPRWIALKNLEINKNSLVLNEGEMLTKIRIPMHHWDIQFFQKVGPKYQYGAPGFVFAAIGKLDKGLISEFKIMISNAEASIKGKTSIETLFIGYPFPLSYRQIKDSYLLIQQFCENLPKGFTALEQYSIKQLIVEVLSGENM